MEEALRRKLVLLVFIPLIVVAVLVAASLWFVFGSSSISLWLVSRGLTTEITLLLVGIVVAFIIVELFVMLHLARLAGQGLKSLFKLLETGRISEARPPQALREDVEFQVIAKKLEQMVRVTKEQAQASRRLVQIENDLREIADALEEVSLGSPFVPLSQREGQAGRIVTQVNKVLPEFYELQRASVKQVGSIEKSVLETREATQELARHAERSFVESTETLVATREVGKLVCETREKLDALLGVSGERAGMQPQRAGVREAVTRVVESAARGIEELTSGLMKASALSRSSERIANRASVLALNVAVEAARASLPGFNVLAEEIRKLAEFARTCSDESAAIIKEIESKVDTVIRTIHISQEEARMKARALEAGGARPEMREGEDSETELKRSTSKLEDAVGKLLLRVQELSRLTERASREAERVNRKTSVLYEQTRSLGEREPCEDSAAPDELSQLETLSSENMLLEESETEEGEGD